MHDAQGGGGAPGDLQLDDSIETLITELEDVEQAVRGLHSLAQNTAEKTGAGWGGRAAMEAILVQNASADELRKLADALGGMATLVRENCNVMEETEEANQAGMRSVTARLHQMGF